MSGPNNDLADDCLALVAIQNHWAQEATNNNLYASHSLRDWGAGGKRINTWSGLFVSGGRVTEMILASTSLVGIFGSIPSEIGNLTALDTLNLSSNRFIGSIPSEIGNLTSLRFLWLHNNRLSGAIPTEIGALTSLTTLRLHNNQPRLPISAGIAPESWLL